MEDLSGHAIAATHIALVNDRDTKVTQFSTQPVELLSGPKGLALINRNGPQLRPGLVGDRDISVLTLRHP
jgi:hypothetical protein